ncbi:MAG: hypothetical protein F4X83_11300 [Chloroflexi bacterium]|nr:hypothetical protein [Chloroflexota bacterium]
MTTKLLIPFAKNAEGKLVTAREVERGLDCNCTCISCGEPLLARHGKEKVWHFSHRSTGGVGGNDGCGEGSIHRAAKEALSQSIGKQFALPDFLRPPGTAKVRAKILRVVPEHYIEEAGRTVDCWIRLDVRCGHNWRVSKPLGIRDLAVEIAVSHKKDAAYRNDMRNADVPSIEIQISLDYIWKRIAKDKNLPVESLLRSIVLNMTTNREWLYLRE